MNASEYLQRNKTQSEIVSQIFEIKRSLKDIKTDIKDLRKILEKESITRIKQFKELTAYIKKIESAYGNGLISSNQMSNDTTPFDINNTKDSNSIFG